MFQLSPAASSEAEKTFAFDLDVLQAAKCKIRVHAVTHCQTHYLGFLMIIMVRLATIVLQSEWTKILRENNRHENLLSEQLS